MKMSYTGFGNEQLEEAKELGEYWECPICHKKEKVEHSEPPILQFVKHEGETFLVGIHGKDISTIPTSCHGELNIARAH